MLLLTLRGKHTLVVLQHEHLVLILLSHCSHVVWGEDTLVFQSEALADADLSKELRIEIDVHVCQLLAGVNDTLHGYFRILLSIQRLAPSSSPMAYLLCRGDRARIRVPMLRYLFLAANRLRIIQPTLPFMAALPCLPRRPLVRARAQWWLIRVVGACTQVILAVAASRHAVTRVMLALLYCSVQGVLLSVFAWF